MAESQTEGAASAAADNEPKIDGGAAEVTSAAPALLPPAKSAAPPATAPAAATPSPAAAPTPSAFLFGDASKHYTNLPKPKAPAPPPEPEPEYEEPPVVVVPFNGPPPLIELDLPPVVVRRLTVPPSPLGAPPPPDAYPKPNPRRISALTVLASFGGLVLLAMVVFTTVIATRSVPPPIPEPQLPPPEVMGSILDTPTDPPPSETGTDPDEHANAPGGRRSRGRGNAAARAVGGTGAAGAARTHDGTVAATPSHEQVAMAARTVRGAVLMCGMSLPTNGPGSCEVNVVFDSSGRVTSAVVSPPYAGTTFGSCVVRAARRMTVPPFSQPTFRATQSFQVH